MNSRLLLVCVLLCGYYHALAQDNTPNATIKVSGKALDGATGKPVEYASVVLLHKADSTVAYGMYTQPTGNFSFTAVKPGDYVLRITFMGYEKMEKEVRVTALKPSTTVGTLRLHTAGKVLSAVEIKAEKPAFSMQIDRQVFDAGSMVTADGGTGTDLLKNVPGVDVDIDDNVTLRGKSVTIYVDGKPSPFGDAKTALQMIPAETVDHVEVISNPSAKFEAQGGGGIINIVLKKDKAVGYNVMFNGGVATRGQLNGSVNGSLRIRRFNFFANYYGRYGSQAGSGFSNRHNLVPDSSNTAYFTQANNSHNSDGSHGGRLGLDYYLDKYNTVSISEGINFSNGNNENHILLNYLDADKQNLRSGDRNNSSHYYNPNNNTNFNFRHTTNKENEELTAYVSYSNNKGNSNSDYYTLYQKPGGAEDPDRQSNTGLNHNQFWNAQSDYTTPMGKKGKFEAGVKGTFRKIDNDYTALLFNYDTDQFEKSNSLSNTYSYKQNIYAGYVNVSSAIGNLGYQVGARIEQAQLKGFSYSQNAAVDNSFFNVFPSVFLKYNLPHNQDQSLVFNYATRVDRPDFNDLLPYINNSDPQNIRTGNPDLQPSLTHKFEVNYSQYYPKSHDFLNTGVYYSQANDDIDRLSILDTITGITTTKPMNLAKDQDWGGNFTYQLHLFRWWDVTSNLNLEYSKLTGSGSFSTLTNEYLTYGVNVNSTLRLPSHFNVQLQGHYRSPRVSPQGTTKAMNGIDLGLRKEFLKNNALAISLNISDLLNTQQFSNHYETEAFIQDYERKRTTRFIRLNLRYRFGKMDPNMFKKKKQVEEPEEPIIHN
ncbi:outer membrane beta-barrel protein [Chitinophaga rupis]|nr:outer membrane beta-barrel protein [Chitinophaga rupis]